MGGSGQAAKASGKGCEHVTGWCSCSSLGGTLTFLVQPCLALSDVLAASSGKRGWRKQSGGRLLIVVFLVAEFGLQGAGASVVVAYEPSCLAACGILLESCGPGIKPVCPALAGRFLYYWTTRGVQSLF